MVDFVARDVTVTVESDTQHIATHFSFSMNYGYTEFEIDLEAELREHLSNRDLVAVRMRFGKRHEAGLEVRSMKEFREIIGQGAGHA